MSQSPPNSTSSNSTSPNSGPLPARARFLATGLTPAINLTATDRTECEICHCRFEDPVRLPCSEQHIFCRACITQWLETSARNTCPDCRRELFELPQDERLDIWLPHDEAPNRGFVSLLALARNFAIHPLFSREMQERREIRRRVRVHAYLIRAAERDLVYPGEPPRYQPPADRSSANDSESASNSATDHGIVDGADRQPRYDSDLLFDFPDIARAARGNASRADQEHHLYHEYQTHRLEGRERTTEEQVVRFHESPEDIHITGEGYINQARLANALAVNSTHWEPVESWHETEDGFIWDELMHTIFTVCIVPDRGTTPDVATLPAVWLHRLREHLFSRASGNGFVRFVGQPTEARPLSGRLTEEQRDVMNVLEYLAFIAWDEQRTRQERRSLGAFTRIAGGIRRRLGTPRWIETFNPPRGPRQI